MDIKVQTLLDKIKSSIPMDLKKNYAVSVEGLVTFLTIDTNVAYFTLDNLGETIRIYIPSGILNNLSFSLKDGQQVKITGHVSLFKHYVQVIANKALLIHDVELDFELSTKLDGKQSSKQKTSLGCLGLLRYIWEKLTMLFYIALSFLALFLMLYGAYKFIF